MLDKIQRRSFLAMYKFHEFRSDWLSLGSNLGIDEDVLELLNENRCCEIEKLHGMFIHFFKNHSNENVNEKLEQDILCALKRTRPSCDFDAIGHFLNSDPESTLAILEKLPFLRDGDFERDTSGLPKFDDTLDFLNTNVKSSDWYMCGLLFGLETMFLLNLKDNCDISNHWRLRYSVIEWFDLKSTHVNENSVHAVVQILKEFQRV